MSESYHGISFSVKFNIVSVDENFHPLNELVTISSVMVLVEGWVGVATQVGAGRSRKSKKTKNIPFGSWAPATPQI